MKKEKVTAYQIHKDLMQCIYNDIMGVIVGPHKNFPKT